MGPQGVREIMRCCITVSTWQHAAISGSSNTVAATLLFLERALFLGIAAFSETKRHRFAVPLHNPLRRVSVQRAKEPMLGPRHVAPPTDVAAKLRASPLAIEFDIETRETLGRRMEWWNPPLALPH